MFLRKRPTSTGTDDANARLREGLILLLRAQASSVPASVGGRMTALADRLDRGKVPTGLTRELSELSKAVRPASEGDDVVDVSQAIRTLTDALGAVAMDDRELRVLIHHFSEWLPRRISAAHARRVSARVAEIERAAPGAWDRIAEAQAATATLVKSLVASIAKASGGPQGMSTNLDALAVTVVQLKDVQGMAELAQRMESQLDGMRLQVALMERELVQARSVATRIQQSVDPDAVHSDHEERLRSHLKDVAG